MNDQDMIKDGLATGGVVEDYGFHPNDDVFTRFVKRYRNDPIGFAQNVLSFDPLPWQQELMLAVRDGTRQISVRSGHGTGKTTCVSIIAIWLLVCGHHGDFKCVITANTEQQMKDGLFAEISKQFKKAPQVIVDLFEIQTGRIYLKAAKDAVFLTARVASQNTPEALSGIHAERMFLVVDEASAVPDQVFENARGSMSSEGAQTVLISNPTRNSGYFFETHHSLSSVWKTFHVSCEDNPLVSEEFKKEFIYGPSDPQWQIRYLGNFASADDRTLIAAELVDSAMTRDIQVDPSADLIYGLDCARFGQDATCLVKRKGNVVISMETWKGLDTMQVAGIVKAQADADHPHIICVDSIGVGAGVADRLRQLGLHVADINVSESSSLNPQANKLRDELWIAVRDWLAKRSCKIPDDAQLRKELVAPRLEYLGNGKMKVEGKDDLRKRLKGASPDHADALCLTFSAQAAGIGGNAPKWIKGQPLKRNLRAVI